MERTADKKAIRREMRYKYRYNINTEHAGEAIRARRVRRSGAWIPTWKRGHKQHRKYPARISQQLPLPCQVDVSNWTIVFEFEESWIWPMLHCLVDTGYVCFGNQRKVLLFPRRCFEQCHSFLDKTSNPKLSEALNDPDFDGNRLGIVQSVAD